MTQTSPLPDDTKAKLAQLWAMPRARIYLARLLLAVRNTPKYGWDAISDDIQALSESQPDHTVFFRSKIPQLNLRNFALRKTRGLIDNKAYNSIALFISHLADNVLHSTHNITVDCSNSVAFHEDFAECLIIPIFRHHIYLKPLSERDYAVSISSIQRSANPIDSLRAIFGIPDEKGRDSHRLLLRHDDRSHVRQAYVCYRYSSKPGWVVKSFVSIEQDILGSPFSIFEHWYQDVDGVGRSTRGHVLPMRRATYLIGSIDNGEAMKIIALHSSASPRIKGLMLSISAKFDPLVARVVLYRCNYNNHNDAAIGTFSENNLDGNLRADLVTSNNIPAEMARLRSDLSNEVSYSIPAHVRDLHDRYVDRESFISIVHQSLNLHTDRPALKLRTENSEKPFNPFADGHLLFNSALRLER